MKKILSSVMAFIMSLFASLFTPVTPLPLIVKAEDAIVQNVKIMNFNLYVGGAGEKSPGNRSSGVVAVIKRFMPDSFGVEEADESWIERLTKALPEYSHTGVGRNRDFSGEASCVFYLNEKYSLVSGETIWLSKTPEVPSRNWDAWINRVASIATLKDRETGFKYTHINAHFDNLGAVSRIEAAAIISKKAACFDAPVVFSGDLNAKEGGLMYKRIIDAGFRDAKYIAENSDAGASYHGYAQLDKINSKPIDYIFVNSGCLSCATYKIVRDKINGIYPSDHYAVTAECKLFCNP